MVDSLHDGERLVALMHRAGVNDPALAAATERSVQAVGKWKATGKIARDRLPYICAALKCSADELLGIVPIQQGVAEEGVRYLTGPDREMLRETFLIVERALSQPGVHISVEGRAEITLEIYQNLQDGQSARAAERIVSGMLRAFTDQVRVGK